MAENKNRSDFDNSEYNKVIKYLEEIPRFTEKHPLTHTEKFLEKLEINEKNFKIIHVAGTNGKGSVCAMLSNILVKSGCKTGLFTSPHLVRYTERIKIDNKEISYEEFVFAFNKVKNIIDDMEKEGYTHPSYFEFIFLMSMVIYKEKQVEFIVLETGLGGRLDATNIFKEPVLTIITSVGMDHMEYLGNTVEAIAGEKAGIIKEGIPVVYWAQDERVEKVISDVAKTKHATAFSVKEKDYKIVLKSDKMVDFYVGSGYYLGCTFRVPFISEYQVQNGMLVIKAIEALGKAEVLSVSREKLYQGISEVVWEGRMENIGDNIILDGAHNAPGIAEFVKTFRQYQCKGKKNILFSVVKDKEYDLMVKLLADTDVSKVYIARMNSYRGLGTARLNEDFEKFNAGIVTEEFDSVEKAYEKAVAEKNPEDALFIVGSLYLIGEIKKLIG